MNGGAKQRTSTSALLALIPALAAASIAGLYVLGTISKMLSLHGANVDSRLALQIVPIRQLLGEGIGASFIAAQLLFFIAIFVFVTRFIPPSRRGQRFAKRHPRLMGIVLVMLASGVILIFSPAVALGIVVAVIARDLTLRRIALRKVISIVFVLSLVGTLGISYFWPYPLPNASLSVAGQSLPVEGSLIAIADGNWYLSRKDGTVEAFEQPRVLHATVRKAPKRHQPRSLIEILLGHRILFS